MEKGYDNEELRRRRERRRQEIRRRRRRQALVQRVFAAVIVAAVLAVILVLLADKRADRKAEEPTERGNGAVQEAQETEQPEKLQKRQPDAGRDEGLQEGQPDTEGAGESEDAEEAQESDAEDTAGAGNSSYHYEDAEEILRPGDEIVSNYMIFVDVEEGTILAGRNEKERMIPASMTKVLTLLVAVEQITDLDAPCTITREAAEYSLRHDCSNAGFEIDETVTVRDLLYGAILPSGADAALSLAACAAGSQEAFVGQMNEKLEELGLSGSAHMTNCVGIYEEDHYCTAYDMAVIMNAAIENETCREVLSAHTYTTSATEQHPEDPSVQLVSAQDRG